MLYIASLPGPAQLSIACSAEKCVRVGRAWERGYAVHVAQT